MARGIIKEASAFSIPIGSSASIGAEGEMARVSIASLLEGAGTPGVATPEDDGVQHVSGRHGMIMDLYSSGSVTLDLGLATPTVQAAVDDVRHDSLAALLNGNVDAGATSLGLAGDQHLPGETHVPVAGQSVLGAVETPLWFASADHVSTLGWLDHGHNEVATFLGNDGSMPPINDQHVIA